MNILLRTAHLATFGVLLGGHAFAVDPERLRPFLYATIASGAGMMVLELVATCRWLVTGAGLAVLVKLAVLLCVPLFWEHRVALLVVVIVIASVAAHMPARWRHRSFTGAAEPWRPGGQPER